MYGIAQISSVACSRMVRLSSGFARGKNDMFHVILQTLGMGLFSRRCMRRFNLRRCAMGSASTARTPILTPKV
jgi:hypothetical protein